MKGNLFFFYTWDLTRKYALNNLEEFLQMRLKNVGYNTRCHITFENLQKLLVHDILRGVLN